MKTITRETLLGYLHHGLTPGDFLKSALLNDFVDAVCRADIDNLRDIREIAQFIYCEIPSQAKHSQENINSWIERGGLSGINSNLKTTSSQ